MEEKKEVKKPEPPKDEVLVKVIWEGGDLITKGEVGKRRPTVVKDTRGFWQGETFHKLGEKFKTTRVKAERWALKGLVKILQ